MEDNTVESEGMSIVPQLIPQEEDLPEQPHSIEISEPALQIVEDVIKDPSPIIPQDTGLGSPNDSPVPVQAPANPTELKVEEIDKPNVQELDGDTGSILNQPIEVIKTEILILDDGKTVAEAQPIAQNIKVEVIKTESTILDGSKTIAEAQPITKDVEAEYDSSPYQSSSEETSSDDSKDSDDDYEMLDPEEQARRLMEGDGSDDEGGKASNGGQLRTANEKIEEVIDIPKIEGISDLKIEELGNVEAQVKNMILIKAKTSGEYQVLESGSVLCLPDRTIIGVVSETLGRVQEPLYCVRFTNEDTIAGLNLERGTTIFYVPQHSTFVFTKALQSIKGSDASNLHDEEIGGEEIEFSDDEAEAEYKRQKKLQRQDRKGNRGGLIRERGNFSRSNDTRPEFQAPSTLSYDDTTMDDELYTPLSRPSSLNVPGHSTHMPSSEGFSRGAGGMRGRGNRGRGVSRGRDDRRIQQSERQPQANTNGNSSYGAQNQYQQHVQAYPPVYPPAGYPYPQTQQQNMYPPQQQYHQPMQYQHQNGQYPNQHPPYQQNQQPQFTNQSVQYNQQYVPQVFPQAGQWPATQQNATGHNLIHHQGAPQGTVPQFGALDFSRTMAYFNSINQSADQPQRQPQMPPLPLPPFLPPPPPPS